MLWIKCGLIFIKNHALLALSVILLRWGQFKYICQFFLFQAFYPHTIIGAFSLTYLDLFWSFYLYVQVYFRWNVHKEYVVQLWYVHNCQSINCIGLEHIHRKHCSIESEATYLVPYYTDQSNFLWRMCLACLRFWFLNNIKEYRGYFSFKK